ncbi:hypothetical protein GCM10022243_17720 [Saccharothrix violaceirubra]|uniref:Uncharacterized protein n=1 Tax=Saccharothrix violaceirubra TaxID=413306 RepID=A0A7W7T1N3_9PSEU|nr:hypothetical protein [Saccharothrix violaceirubra]MBB4964437.1 hypothetical protein [Saccharothrix violaceirubra]
MPDPLLDRTLCRVRAERARTRTRIRTAAATLLAVLLATGVHLGRHSVPGERVLTASAHGTSLSATVTPDEGWIRLKASIDGIPPGEHCHLVVEDDRGTRTVAAGWVASAAEHTDVAGTALVDPDAVVGIEVETTDGRVLITARWQA